MYNVNITFRKARTNIQCAVDFLTEYMDIPVATVGIWQIKDIYIVIYVIQIRFMRYVLRIAGLARMQSALEERTSYTMHFFWALVMAV